MLVIRCMNCIKLNISPNYILSVSFIMKATHLSLRFGQNKILKPILKCLTIACICMWGKEKQSRIQQVIADMIPLGPSLCMNHEFMNITIHL